MQAKEILLPFRKFELCKDKCARLLLTLPFAEVDALKTTISVILQNIRKHQNEEKYRRLKPTNANLQTKVFSKAGAVEVLLSLGFQWEKEEEEEEEQQLMVFPEAQPLHISQCCLRDIMEKYELLALSSPTLRAQALIMLQLPTGKKITGGFMLKEDLRQIFRFACSYFETDR